MTMTDGDGDLREGQSPVAFGKEVSYHHTHARTLPSGFCCIPIYYIMEVSSLQYLY